MHESGRNPFRAPVRARLGRRGASVRRRADRLGLGLQLRNRAIEHMRIFKSERTKLREMSEAHDEIRKNCRKELDAALRCAVSAACMWIEATDLALEAGRGTPPLDAALGDRNCPTIPTFVSKRIVEARMIWRERRLSTAASV